MVWRRKWLAAEREKVGPKSAAYARGMIDVGDYLIVGKRPADAEPFLREGLAILQEQQPEGWKTAHAHTLLGIALLDQKRYAEAEPWLIRGYEGPQGPRGPDPAVASRAHHRRHVGCGQRPVRRVGPAREGRRMACEDDPSGRGPPDSAAFHPETLTVSRAGPGRPPRSIRGPTDRDESDDTGASDAPDPDPLIPCTGDRAAGETRPPQGDLRAGRSRWGTVMTPQVGRAVSRRTEDRPPSLLSIVSRTRNKEPHR